MISAPKNTSPGISKKEVKAIFYSCFLLQIFKPKLFDFTWYLKILNTKYLICSWWYQRLSTWILIDIWIGYLKSQIQIVWYFNWIFEMSNTNNLNCIWRFEDFKYIYWNCIWYMKNDEVFESIGIWFQVWGDAWSMKLFINSRDQVSDADKVNGMATIISHGPHDKCIAC